MQSRSQQAIIDEYHRRRRGIIRQYQPQIAELQERMLKALLAVDREFYQKYPHLMRNGAEAKTPQE